MVATAEGDNRLIYRKIQYLNTVSKTTGTVAINRKIKFLLAGRPKWLANPSRTTSQPCGEWNPTNISVHKMMIKALALSLRSSQRSPMKDFKTITSLFLVKMIKAKVPAANRSEKTLLIALLLLTLRFTSQMVNDGTH